MICTQIRRPIHLPFRGGRGYNAVRLTLALRLPNIVHTYGIQIGWYFVGSSLPDGIIYTYTALDGNARTVGYSHLYRNGRYTSVQRSSSAHTW